MPLDTCEHPTYNRDGLALSGHEGASVLRGLEVVLLAVDRMAVVLRGRVTVSIKRRSPQEACGRRLSHEGE